MTDAESCYINYFDTQKVYWIGPFSTYKEAKAYANRRGLGREGELKRGVFGWRAVLLREEALKHITITPPISLTRLKTPLPIL